MEPTHELELGRITPGMAVYDIDGQKIGSLAHVYRREAGAAREGYLEVKTGFFVFGKHLYVPLSAIRDVTDEGVFLSQRHDAVQQMGWHTKPADLEAPAGAARAPAPAPGSEPRRETIRPPAPETVAPSGTSAPSAAGAARWQNALPHYRARFEQHYGAHASMWDQYEPRYRFAWEMGQRPEFAGRSWFTAQADLRREWERRASDTTWDQAADAVRDAWEHPAGAPTDERMHA